MCFVAPVQIPFVYFAENGALKSLCSNPKDRSETTDSPQRPISEPPCERNLSNEQAPIHSDKVAFSDTTSRTTSPRHDVNDSTHKSNTFKEHSPKLGAEDLTSSHFEAQMLHASTELTRCTTSRSSRDPQSLQQPLNAAVVLLLKSIPNNLIDKWQNSVCSTEEAETTFQLLINELQGRKTVLSQISTSFIRSCVQHLNNNKMFCPASQLYAIETCFLLLLFCRMLDNASERQKNLSVSGNSFLAKRATGRLNTVAKIVATIKCLLTKHYFLTSYQRSSFVSSLLLCLSRFTAIDAVHLIMFTSVEYFIFDSRCGDSPNGLALQVFVQNGGPALMHSVAYANKVPMPCIALCFRLMINIIQYNDQEPLTAVSTFLGPTLDPGATPSFPSAAPREPTSADELTSNISTSNALTSNNSTSNDLTSNELTTFNGSTSNESPSTPYGSPATDNLSNHLEQFQWYFRVATDCAYLYRILTSPTARLRAFHLLAQWPASPSDLLERVLYALTVGHETATGSSALVHVNRTSFFLCQPYDRTFIFVDLILYCVRYTVNIHLWEKCLDLIIEMRHIFYRLDALNPQNEHLLTKLATRIADSMVHPPLRILFTTDAVRYVSLFLQLLDHSVLGNMAAWKESKIDKPWHINNKAWWQSILPSLYQQLLDFLGLHKRFFPKLFGKEQEPHSLVNYALKFFPSTDTCKLRSLHWQSLVFTLSAMNSAVVCPHLLLIPLYVLRERGHQIVALKDAKTTTSSKLDCSLEEPSFIITQLNSVRTSLVIFRVLFSRSTSYFPTAHCDDAFYNFCLVHILLGYQAVQSRLKRSSTMLLWDVREYVWVCLCSFLVVIEALLNTPAAITLFVSMQGFELLTAVARSAQSGYHHGRPELLLAIRSPDLANYECSFSRIVRLCMGVACTENQGLEMRSVLFHSVALNNWLTLATPHLRHQLLDTIAVPLITTGRSTTLTALDAWNFIVCDILELPRSSYYVQESFTLLIDLLEDELIARYRKLLVSLSSLSPTLAGKLCQDQRVMETLVCCHSPWSEKSRSCCPFEETSAQCFTCLQKRPVNYFQFWMTQPHLRKLACKVKAFILIDDALLLLHYLITTSPSRLSHQSADKKNCSHQTALSTNCPTFAPFNVADELDDRLRACYTSLPEDQKSFIVKRQFFSLHALPLRCLQLVARFLIVDPLLRN